MRIAHVTTVHRWDDGRIFERQARSLARAGHEVWILAPGTDAFSVDDVEVIPLGIARRRSDRMWRLVREAGRVIRRLDPDVVIVHDPELLRMVIALSFRRRRPRLVYDAHEDYSAQIRDKEWLPAWSRGMLAVLLGQMELLAARRTEMVFSATPTIAARFPGSKTHVVLNRPVLADMPKITEPSHGSTGPNDGSTWALAYVGDLRTIRGAETLIKALTLLNDDPVRLHLVGRITPASLESDLSLEPGWSKVVQIGWSAKATVYDVLASADVAVLPFLPAHNHIESQPNKLFEYLVMGLPVVMSDFPGWVEIAEEVGARYEIFASGDPHSLAQAMSRIFVEPCPELRGERSMRARKLLGWEHSESSYLTVFTRLEFSRRSR
jgi:glycosyltransferase involved in cell wall biosynthesis